MRSRLIGCLAGLLCIAFAQQVRAETWRTYQNARYGTVAEYPADRFHPGSPPANGDGQRFTAADGAELLIFAGLNIKPSISSFIFLLTRRVSSDSNVA
jgi:hypothetical protein